MTTLLLPKQVAEVLHETERTVMRRVRDGEIAHVRISNRVYFTPEQIADFISAHAVAASSTGGA